MHQKNFDKWFRIYNWLLVTISILLVVFYFFVKYVPSFMSLRVVSGLTIASTIIAAYSIAYGVLLFRYIAQKTNDWLASLVGSMIFILNTMYLLVNSSGNATYIYILFWYSIGAFSGLYGFAIMLCFNFLTIVFILLRSGFHLTLSDTHLIVLFLGSAIISTATYLLFWQTERIPLEKRLATMRMNDLTGIEDDSKKQSETIIESIADGVVVLDNEKKISLINPSASKMTGWPVEEALGIDVYLVFKLTSETDKPIPVEKEPFNNSLELKERTEQTAILTDKMGGKVVISLVVSPVIIDGESVGVVGVFRDVSAQKAAEKARADFISTASHEMRTPVAAIEGYLSLAMNEKVSNIDDRAREYLEKAHTSTQQLGRLFQDLLTSSRAEDGRLVNHPEVVEMSAFIGQLAEGFQLAAEKKGLLVDFSIAPDGGDSLITGKVVKPLYYVLVDPERMREVVTNIYDNAVKYTASGKISLGINGDKDFVHVFIKDTGVGIPADDIPHLFQKFYRVDNSAVRTIGGTGLGLYICKKILELYHGKIWVESELNKGSTFHIDLPRLGDQQAEALKVSENVRNAVTMPSTN